MNDLIKSLSNNRFRLLGLGSGTIVTLIIAAIIFFAIFPVYESVPSGSVGVVTHFGAVQNEILPEGLHLIMPVQTKVIPIDIRIHKIEAEASASSKDLQVVTSKVALNFFLDKEKANVIFQNLGLNYQSTIIEPAIQESIKSTTAQFTAEQLITLRPQVKEAVSLDIKARLAKHDILVSDFSIIDFNFSPEFNKAIEEKQVAEQRALRANNDLTRIRTEAEQTRARAEGEAQAKLELAKAEAEAQRLLRETLSPEIIELRAIEQWNGIMPVVMSDSGSGLFYDVSNITQHQSSSLSLPTKTASEAASENAGK